MTIWRALAMGLVVSLGLVSGAASVPATVVYLALGDSIAAGHGASAPERSYVGHELARLRSQHGGHVHLALYATGGATTEGLRRWQAPAAAAELQALRDGLRAGLRPGPITVTIGGNDMLALFGQAVLTGRAPEAALVQARAQAVEANLVASLTQLIQAGGPATRITVTTYYDPSVAWPDGPTRRLARDGLQAVNAAIERAATRFPAQVRVAQVERLLPGDGSIVDYLADEIHPNDRGHAVIAAAVASAWVVPEPGAAGGPGR